MTAGTAQDHDPTGCAQAAHVPAHRAAGTTGDSDEATARRLAEMAALVSSGLSPEAAALRVRVQDDHSVPEEPETPLGDPDALARAAVGFDVQALGRALDEGFALGEFEQVVDGWLLPSLDRLGKAWEEGRINVAEEHFVSASVHRRLAQVYDATPRPLHAPRVLVGLAPGSRHELGVLAFATALLRRGVDAVYLGADVPVPAWVGAVERRHLDGVVISVPSREDVATSRELVAALSLAVPEVPVLIGGGFQDLVGDDVTLLGHHMVPAAERLASALRAKV